MTKELKEKFEEIRQQVINEMFEGKRPVFKKLTELSTSDLEMKCMEKAYVLDRQEWISIAIKEPPFERIMIWSLIMDEPSFIEYDDRELLKYFKHWQPLPKPPLTTT